MKILGRVPLLLYKDVKLRWARECSSVAHFTGQQKLCPFYFWLCWSVRERVAEDNIWTQNKGSTGRWRNFHNEELQDLYPRHIALE